LESVGLVFVRRIEDIEIVAFEIFQQIDDFARQAQLSEGIPRNIGRCSLDPRFGGRLSLVHQGTTFLEKPRMMEVVT
jgi:hypothetical protein